MTLAQILVTVGGIVLIVLIFWYFFWSEGERVRATASEEGIQEIEVQVKGGYTPDLIVVEVGRPVRLDFHRNETADCSEEIVFGDFGIRKRLPAFRTTPVEFTPEEPGEYVFTCGMGMLKGKVLVERSANGRA